VKQNRFFIQDRTSDTAASDMVETVVAAFISTTLPRIISCLVFRAQLGLATEAEVIAAVAFCFGPEGEFEISGDSLDYVCLDFGSNLPAAMSVCNGGRGVVGCLF
jgi:hypothetical protein